MTEFPVIPAGAEVRGLTLWEPWATLVATGQKRLETRSWDTSYRGWVAIHAAKHPPDMQACSGWGVAHALTVACRSTGWATDALQARFREQAGKVLAVAELVATADTEAPGALLEQAWATHMRRSLELELGDYSLGRYCWLLSNVHRLAAPVPAVGKQRLWRPQRHELAALKGLQR